MHNRQLELFSGRDDARGMPLLACYELLVRPVKSCRPETITACRTAIRWFERLVPEGKFRPVSQITSRDLAIFRACWVSGSGLTPQTFNKHLRHLKSVLNELLDMEVIDKPLRCKPLPEQEPKVRIATQEQVAALYEACAFARWPVCRSYSPAAYWRSLIVVGCTTGLRKSDILRIRHSDLDLSSKTLTYRAGKTGKLRVIPLHDEAARHLELLWRPDSDPLEPLFWSTRSNRQFYREWATVNRMAEIAPALDVHDLRRTCGSWVFQHSGLNAASELLAHSSPSVTRKHYLATAIVAESLRGAVNSIHLALPVRQGTIQQS